MSREDGFTLIEAIAVLAIVGVLAALALPRLGGDGGSQRLAGYAMEIATLLKSDRNAAMRQGAYVATGLSLSDRSVRSGFGGRLVRLPADVAFDATVAETCYGRRTGRSIDFFPSGMSCGGVIAIARGGAGYQIRVNWLTGGVDIVPVAKS